MSRVKVGILGGAFIGANAAIKGQGIDESVLDYTLAIAGTFGVGMASVFANTADSGYTAAETIIYNTIQKWSEVFDE